jgi:hypothetical protein
MNKEEIIKEVITILETSDYVDTAEDLYDGLKQIKREITYSTIHDFCWALESSTVIDVDGKVAECAKKIKPLLADMTIDEAYENYSKEYVKTEIKMEYKSIGTVGNYYGGLFTMEKDGKYYWVIENYSTKFDDLTHWDECDKELYEALIAYEERRKK